MRFKLRFPKSDVMKWAARFDDPQADAMIERIGARVGRRGYLTRDEFLAVCRWKSPRSQALCALNDSITVRAVTTVALEPATPDRYKLPSLLQLSGVGWPTASVILHFFDARPFPILDYRALWSVSQAAPLRYSDDLWRKYTLFTRGLAAKIGCNMRTLDRALWQYSKEKQPGPRKI